MASPPDLKFVRFNAVMLGWLTDVGTTILAGIALGAAYGISPTDQAGLDRLNSASDFLYASLAIGLVCTAIGGFVAAQLAPSAEIVNAIGMGVVSAGSALVLALTGEGGPPVWYLALGTALTVPAAMVGGFLRQRTRAS